MRLFPRAGNYMVSLKDQLWIHDYDWESCNVTRMTRNPITPVVVKVKVRRQLSCRFFPAPVVFGQGGGGWWTTMCIKLCGSWMEIEFQDIIHFFVIFLKMYLVK